MLARNDELFDETGHYAGLERARRSRRPTRSDFEKLFCACAAAWSRARETALNISASPIVRELGEMCFALYTPEGDSSRCRPGSSSTCTR